MGEVVNLRRARKQAAKLESEKRAAANRIAYGRPKSEQTLEDARAQKLRRNLDAHRIDSGEPQ